MYIQFTKVWFKSKPVTNYLELVWLCFVSRPSWFNTNKNLFFCKKQISRSLQLLRVLCKKIFQFLFLFVLFLVGILLLSSRLRWFWAEHQWFTSLKWEQAKTEQFLKKFKELWDWIVFPSLSFTIRLENPHHTFNQSDAKVKTNCDTVIRSPALRPLSVFTLSVHWLCDISYCYNWPLCLLWFRNCSLPLWNIIGQKAIFSYPWV